MRHATAAFSICLAVGQVLGACYQVASYESRQSGAGRDSAAPRDDGPRTRDGPADTASPQDSGLADQQMGPREGGIVDPCLAAFVAPPWTCRITMTGVNATCGTYELACHPLQASCDCLRGGVKRGVCFTTGQVGCQMARVAFPCCNTQW